MAANTDHKKLDALIEKATRLLVHEGDVFVFESTEPADLVALRYAARIIPSDEQTHCMCNGNTLITLYAGPRRLGLIADLTGRIVRFSGCHSDNELASPARWLGWFHTRGIHGPCGAFDKFDQQRAANSPETRLKWVGAIPAPLQTFWPQMELAAKSGRQQVDVAVLREALTRCAADEPAQIRAVLSWYAAGSGLWSGYPPYEHDAERLLLSFSTAALVSAVEGTEDDAVLDGAARLFSDWYFCPAEELQSIPARLKAQLLQRALESPIPDNRYRAHAAFSPSR